MTNSVGHLIEQVQQLGLRGVEAEAPHGQAQLLQQCQALGQGQVPGGRTTLQLMVPPPSMSNRLKASCNCAICSGISSAELFFTNEFILQIVSLSPCFALAIVYLTGLSINTIPK